MKLFNLFIDESGIANPKANRSGCYILCGCLTNAYSREQLRIKADQIKFKFWEKTNIVFHSREIWRKEKDFSSLKDEETNKSFQKLIFDFLTRGSYQVFVVVVDNNKAVKLNWDNRKVYKETSDIIVRNFILSLLATKARGRLVIESATSEKDFLR